MKLSHLTLAITAGLALAACGGAKNSNGIADKADTLKQQLESAKSKLDAFIKGDYTKQLTAEEIKLLNLSEEQKKAYDAAVAKQEAAGSALLAQIKAGTLKELTAEQLAGLSSKQKGEYQKLKAGSINQSGDSKDNVGNAAYRENKETTTVGQLYVRGSQSKFDRELNPEKSNNSTVIGYKSLQNRGLTNIVVGRETIELKASEESIRRYAGQGSVQGKSAPNWNDELSLQTWNSLLGIPASAEAAYNEAAQAYQEFLQSKTKESKEKYEAALQKAREAAGKKNIDEVVNQLGLAGSNVDVTGEFAHVDRNRFTTADNGLVKITKTGRLLETTGQDHQTIELEKDNVTVKAVYDGQRSPTRIFGRNYNATEGANNSGAMDVVSRDDLTKVAQNEANSWVYGLKQAGYKVDKDGNKHAEEKAYNKIEKATDSFKQISKQSVLAANTDKVNDGYGLAATAQKLNYVQYGRVTNNIDPLVQLKGKNSGLQEYYYAPYASKYTYSAGEKITEANPNVDTYFYRGLGETSLEDMKKVAASGKKLDYFGHALMYGIDNSYHGETALGDSNSFAFGSNKVGLGNFVTATFDTAAGKVEGYIYNAWLADESNKDVTIDKLVTFEGKVRGNSAQGTAGLAYGETKGKQDGSFKASFFGNAAEELGGSVNSTSQGYEDAKWGGVFGAQHIGPKASPKVQNNANQVE